MTITLVQEQKLERDTHCLGCEMYGLFGPKCEFENLIKNNLDIFVEKIDGKVDCKRPENCIKQYGL